MIALKNLSKAYGDSVIFEDASFDFPEKGLVCVLGPSGCGKTTLLNLLAGFDSEYEGQILIHGTSLSAMAPAQLCAYRRDNIGFVFQNYHLLSGYTALENLLLATDAAGESRAEGRQNAGALLEKLGLSGKAEQKIETLSGGQKQRVAIARALVNGPSVILADEPTGALDRKNSNEIMALLKQLAEHRLVIVITHDPACASDADCVLTISDGKLCADAPPANTAGTAALRQKKAPKLPLWTSAFKNFKVHFARYVAVALAISIGTLCFMLSLSSGNIMEQAIAEFEEKNTAYHTGFWKADGTEAEVLRLLSADDRIEDVYAQQILRDITVRIGDRTVSLAEKYPSAAAKQQLSYGVMPREGKQELAISPSMAAKFAANIQSLIGQTAEVSYQGQTYSLTVSGIFNAVYDDLFVSADIEREMMEGQSDKPYSISYRVKSFEDIVPLSEALRAQGLLCEDASSEVAAFLNTFQNLKRLFLTVSVLILAIGIFISTVLLVKQQNTRYREVGLLSALGYPKGSIGRLLLYENLGLCALSALCSGVFTALALAISGAAGFPLVFSAWQIASTLCVTAVLILGISLASSLRLVHTQPAEALRR